MKSIPLSRTKIKQENKNNLNIESPYQQFLLVSLTQANQLIKSKDKIDVNASCELLKLINEIEDNILKRL